MEQHLSHESEHNTSHVNRENPLKRRANTFAKACYDRAHKLRKNVQTYKEHTHTHTSNTPHTGVPPVPLYKMIHTAYDSQGLEQTFILGISSHKYQQTTAYTTYCIFMLNYKLL